MPLTARQVPQLHAFREPRGTLVTTVLFGDVRTCTWAGFSNGFASRGEDESARCTGLDGGADLHVGPSAHLLVDGDRRSRGIGVGALAPLIVLDAEVLDDFAIRRSELGRVRHGEWLGKSSRILNRHDTLQRVVVGPRVPFDEVQLLCVWRSGAVEPELVVEP